MTAAKPFELSKGALERIVRQVQELLWLDNERDWTTAKEWDADTVAEVASILTAYDLNPREEE